jgi:tetratricopeptide (TPR) repeat protein
VKRFKYLRDNIQRIEKEKRRQEKHRSKRTKEDLTKKLLNTLEKKADVLIFIGKQEEARKIYKKVLTIIPKSGLISQVRIFRKIGYAWRDQYLFDKSMENYHKALTMLQNDNDREQTKSEWKSEWIQIHLVIMEIYYFLQKIDEIMKISEKMNPVIEKYASPYEKSDFMHKIALATAAKDHYTGSEQTLEYCQKAITLSRESGLLSIMLNPQFFYGFNLLWADKLDEAEKELYKALNLAKKTGNILNSTLALTYLTVLFRKLRNIEKTKEYWQQSLSVIQGAHNLLYVAVAKANQSWIEWKENKFSEAENSAKEAIAIWDKLPLEYPFKWLGIFPLLAVYFHQDRIGRAVEGIQLLLGEKQQPLPKKLKIEVEYLITQWKSGHYENAKEILEKILDLAKEYRYL